MDAGEITRRLEDLREIDSLLGSRAEADADAYRRAQVAPGGDYVFPELPAYQRCYPSPFRRRTGVSRVIVSLFRRIVLKLNPVLPLVWTAIGRSRTRVVTTGDWRIFVGGGCVLESTNLSRLMLGSELDGVEFAYGDSVHWDPGNKFDYVHQLRPGWSPERLRSHCYVGGVILARRHVVDAAGGVSVLRKLGPHARAVRVAGAARSHAHVNVVLYRSPRSLAMPESDPLVTAHNPDHEYRPTTGIACDGIGKITSREPTRPAGSVCVIIPTKGTVDSQGDRTEVLAARAVRSLLASESQVPLELLVVVDEGTPASAIDEIRVAGGSLVRFIQYSEPFNFAKKINIAAVQTDCEYLLLVNDDTEVVTPGAVSRLLSVIERDGVGAVAPVLTYEDGTVQSAGHLLNPLPLDLYRGYPYRSEGGWGMLAATREVSSLIAAFLLVRRNDYLDVGGLCEKFPSDYNDVDFALKLGMVGKSSVVTPDVTCIHSESKTRVPGLDAHAISLVGRRWQHRLENDPYGHRFLQPYEFIWKSNEDTRASLDSAVGCSAAWDSDEWFALQAREDRQLHRTMFFPHKVGPR